MNDFRLPLGQFVEDAIDFVTEAFGGLFAVIRTVFAGLYDAVDLVLSTPPFWIVIVAVAALGYFCLLYTSPSPRDRS